MSYEIDGDKVVIKSEGTLPIDNDGIRDLDGLKVELDIHKLDAVNRALNIMKDSGVFSPSIAHGADIVLYQKDEDDQITETDNISADWGDDEPIVDRRVLFGKLTNSDGEEKLIVGIDARPKFSDGSFYAFSVASIDIVELNQAITDLDDSAPAMR